MGAPQEESAEKPSHCLQPWCSHARLTLPRMGWPHSLLASAPALCPFLAQVPVPCWNSMGKREERTCWVHGGQDSCQETQRSWRPLAGP